MSDEAQAGRARHYQELLEKSERWTPKTLSEMPLAQLRAVFGAREDVDNHPGALSRAFEAARAKQEQEGG